MKRSRIAPRSNHRSGSGHLQRVGFSKKFQPVLEQLELRELLAADTSVWQNPSNRFDVNADSHVTPVDALLIINDLNQFGARSLLASSATQSTTSRSAATPSSAPQVFMDVTGDGFVTPLDAINVINQADENDRVQIRVQAVNADGATLTSVNPNDDFFIQVLVKDIRPAGSPRGVFSAYVDVNYDENLVFVDSGATVEFGAEYPNQQDSDLSTPGLINDTGAFASFSPLGSGEFVLWQVQATALAAGNVTFTLDPADDTGHEVSVYDVSGPSGMPEVPPDEIDFIDGQLAITESPLLSVDSVTVTEGNAGTTNATFTVTLSDVSASTVTVAFATADGTATAGSDYTAQSGTLTFDPGQTSKTVTVAVTGDVVDEVNETYFLNLSSPTNAAIGAGQGTGAITDDDFPSISIGDVTQNEGDSGTTTFNFTVSLSAASAKTVTVRAATAPNTATATADYTTKIQTLTFAPGQTTQVFSVNVVADETAEATEAFFVNLTNAAPVGVTLQDAQGVGTIVDDDSSLPTLSIGNAQVTEGDAGTVNADFTVTLSAISATPVTVEFNTAEGTALSPSDYVTQSGTLTFAPGETTKTISVAVNGDTDDETNETFTVTLSNASGATVASGPGTGTITDDDGPGISIGDATVTEGDSGTTNATFTVTLSAASPQAITVAFATADDSATQPGDYSSQTGTITFAAGETSKTITVPVNGDTTNEQNEQFFVNLSSPTNATLGDDQGVGTITDDDGPRLAIDDVTVTEGNAGTVNATFTVTLIEPDAEGVVTVEFATAPGSASSPGDFASQTGTLTFNQGETTKTITVVVNGDTVDEANETFLVNLMNPTGATLSDASGTGTITDDDAAPVLNILTPSAASEGNSGSTPLNFTVTLTGATEQTVTVAFGTADGSATSPADYQGQSGSLTFAPGETTKTIPVPIVGDLLDEVDETFTVTLSNPTNATIDTATATGTITDDDVPPTISINDVTVTEGDLQTVQATFTVSLSAASGQTVTVAFATANDTATAGSDYVAQNGVLTFAAGETSKTISVVVNGDLRDETDETFFVNLSSPTNATLNDPQGVGTITDNDPAPNITINDISVNEGDSGTTNANFTVTLSAASDKLITVEFATNASGTASTPGDFTTTTGTLTFNPGDTTKTISVPIVGDLVDEANENFAVDLSNAVNATITDATGIGTIIDNEGPNVTINDVTVTEGNSGTTNATFTVTLSATSPQEIFVTFATATNTAGSGDFTTQTGTLTFAPGETSKTITIAVTGDTVDETDESFFVNLSNANGATITDAQGVGTITDDDGPNITINDVSVTEGNSGQTNATFTVTLSAASPQQVTVAFATANGSATAGSDYTTTSGTLTFAPGETTKTISVPVLGDMVGEGNENFFVNLSGATNASITDAQGIGTILDDEFGTISGHVYKDTNNDGVQNPGEQDFAGVTVQLTPVAGGATRTVTTDADGNFTFVDVPPGEYFLTEITPPGFLDGDDQVGSFGGTKIEPDTFRVTVVAGQNGTGYIFGERGFDASVISLRDLLASSANGTSAQNSSTSTAQATDAAFAGTFNWVWP